MLVLSRKVGEVLKIGDDIEIMVVRISPNTARLGISAPRHVNVSRPETKGKPPCSDSQQQSELESPSDS